MLWRLVGAVSGEAPSGGASQGGKAVTMGGETLYIGRTQILGAPRQHLALALHAQKAHPTVIRQAFLGGVQDLEQVASAAQARQPIGQTIQRIEKIPHQNRGRVEGEPHIRPLPRRALQGRGQTLQCSGSGGGSQPAIQQRHPLATPDQQCRQGQKQQFRPMAFGGQMGGGPPIHGGRAIAPHPNGLGRRPFALAQEQLVGASRLPPVDGSGGIARLGMAELPETLTRPGAAASMGALGHRSRDPAGLHQQRRQKSGKVLGLMPLVQDQRTLLT